MPLNNHRGQRWAWLAAVTLVSFFTTACGTIVLPVTAAPRGAATPNVAITVWHAQTGAARSVLEAMIADFGKAHPWIAIRSEAKASDGDLLRQGLAAIALNQAPDLVIAGPRTIAELARRGAPVDLNPFADDPANGLKPGERADMLPGSLQAVRLPEFPDQLIAFPFDERPMVLYVNLDLLSAGKVSRPPRTWEEFSEAARSATHEDVRGWVTSADAMLFYALLLGRGGSILDEGQALVQFNRDSGMETLQMLASLSQGDAAYLVDSPAAAQSDFVRGMAALWIGTTSDLPAVSAAKFRWTMVNVPQTDTEHPVTAMGGSKIALFHTVEDRTRAAWLLTRWLTLPEQAARWSQTTLAVPVRLSAMKLLAGSGGSDLEMRLRLSLEGNIPAERPLPMVKDAASIDQAVSEMWAAVVGESDPAAAMAQAVNRANRVLGQTQ